MSPGFSACNWQPFAGINDRPMNPSLNLRLLLQHVFSSLSSSNLNHCPTLIVLPDSPVASYQPSSGSTETA